jgi:beta-mannanase
MQRIYSLLGSYYGNQGWEMEYVKALENFQGKKHAVVNLFTNWCDQTTTIDNLFNQQLPKIWSNQNIPLITWEPYLCDSASTPPDVVRRAANGEYDTYINKWADRLKTFLSGPDGVYQTSDDRRVYIRLAHEMNGNWYPWSAALGGSTPTDYVLMWKRVKGIFDNKGLDAKHVQWVWCVNNTDVGNYPAESFYPGDAYVDWIAIDGYNWGTSQTWSSWQPPDQTFGSMMTRLQAMTTKPLAITELGTSTIASSGTDLAAKSQWLTDAFNYALTKNIKMVLWFNQDKETDWAAFGGAQGDTTFTYNLQTFKTYAAYKTAISSNSFVSSNTTNPRLLTDNQFAGQ